MSSQLKRKSTVSHVCPAFCIRRSKNQSVECVWWEYDSKDKAHVELADVLCENTSALGWDRDAECLVEPSSHLLRKENKLDFERILPAKQLRHVFNMHVGASGHDIDDLVDFLTQLPRTCVREWSHEGEVLDKIEDILTKVDINLADDFFETLYNQSSDACFSLEDACATAKGLVLKHTSLAVKNYYESCKQAQQAHVHLNKLLLVKDQTTTD